MVKTIGCQVRKSLEIIPTGFLRLSLFFATSARSELVQISTYVCVKAYRVVQSAKMLFIVIRTIRTIDSYMSGCLYGNRLKNTSHQVYLDKGKSKACQICL